MLKKVFYTFLCLLVIAIGRFTYPLIYQFFISPSLTGPVNQPAIIAHRGAAGQAPENTLAAFRLALDQNVAIIEFDIHPSKDGRLMVIHDPTLDRTTNRQGPVTGYTLAELRQMDAGSWFGPDFAGEKIPTLKEVLTLINGRAQCIIELKWGSQGYYLELASRVAAEIAAVNGHSWCLVQSYEGRYLAELNRLDPDIKLVKAFIGLWPGPVGFYYDTKLHWGSYRPPPYIRAVNIYYRALTKAQVEDWHRQGVKVWSYTLNDGQSMKKHINLGVDGIITDYPEQLQQILAARAED